MRPRLVKTKGETIRRLRLEDMRRLLRWRYGPTLPDDDCGREDLYDLLLPVSLGPEPQIKMANAINIHAPWMSAKERLEVVAAIERTPPQVRKINAKALGERQRVTNREREALRLWTIAPCDMTEEQLEEQRKAKHKARSRRYRAKLGGQTRQEYLAANSASRDKPWVKQGISKATYYRHKNMRQVRDADITETGRHRPVSRSKLGVRKLVVRGGEGSLHRGQPIVRTRREVRKAQSLA